MLGKVLNYIVNVNPQTQSAETAVNVILITRPYFHAKKTNTTLIFFITADTNDTRRSCFRARDIVQSVMIHRVQTYEAVSDQGPV